MKAAEAYSITEAAEVAGVSPDTIKRAIHATVPTPERPSLRAKKLGAKYLVLADDLRAWLQSLPDA